MPLPTAAAKASVSIGNAGYATDAKLMESFVESGDSKGTPPLPDLGRADMPMVSPTVNGCQRHG